MTTDEEQSGSRQSSPEVSAPAAADGEAPAPVPREELQADVETEEPEATTATGALLSAARKRQELAVVEVAQKLRLTEHYVRALEAGDYAKLPGEVFVKGYLRSYALLLGVEIEEIMASYRGADPSIGHGQDSTHAEPSKTDRNWLPLLLLAAVAGGALVLAGWWLLREFGWIAGA